MQNILDGLCLAVIGGDDREIYLVPHLQSLGAEIIGFGLENSSLGETIRHAESFQDVISSADVLLFPMFGTDERGLVKAKYAKEPIFLNKEILQLIPPGKPLVIGWARPALKAAAQNMNIALIETMYRDDIAILNSIPSAEGAVQMAMEATTITIHGSNSYVLGMGRLGVTLARLLKGMGANVTAAARQSKDLARAKEMGLQAVDYSDMESVIGEAEIVFNTVPAMVLDRQVLDKMSNRAVIIDLASIPGGVDFEYAQKLGIRAQLAPGLPGIVAPETAGKILAQIYPRLVLEHLRPNRYQAGKEGGCFQ